jgi:hypothetical protein
VRTDVLSTAIIKKERKKGCETELEAADFQRIEDS